MFWQAAETDEVRLLRDITNEDDWGLDALAPEAARRPSLLSQIAREQRDREAEGFDAGPGPGGDVVTWGGSGGATGIDLEEQEELLSRFFRPHEVKRYMAFQREIDDNYAAMRVGWVWRAVREGVGGGGWAWRCRRAGWAWDGDERLNGEMLERGCLRCAQRLLQTQLLNSPLASPVR